jgi:hypothetical protein
MIEFYEEKEGFGQWQRVYGGDRKVYRFSDLHDPKVEAVLKKAQDMYTKACQAHFKKHGDFGSCVLGNGLAIAVKPPKARSVFKLLICSPRGGGQSESAGYSCKDPVLAFLKENGIDAWYECGRMD